MSKQCIKLTINQKKLLKKLDNPYEGLSDSDDYIERDDNNNISNQIFIKYDSDNDDKILNEEYEDLTPLSADKYDSDNN